MDVGVVIAVEGEDVFTVVEVAWVVDPPPGLQGSIVIVGLVGGKLMMDIIVSTLLLATKQMQLVTTEWVEALSVSLPIHQHDMEGQNI